MLFLTGAVITLALQGCDEAAGPERPEPYSFTMGRLADGFPLIFRWTEESLPVKFWAEPKNSFPEIVGRSIATWEAAAIYGEFRGVMVRDSSRADVLIFADAFVSGPIQVDNETLACEGSMMWTVGLDTNIVLPIRVRIAPRFGFNASTVNPCLQKLSNKFVGHTLGMLVPSPNPEDLLSGQPMEEQPSPRDLATFVTLYHTVPTVGVPDTR